MFEKREIQKEKTKFAEIAEGNEEKIQVSHSGERFIEFAEPFIDENGKPGIFLGRAWKDGTVEGNNTTIIIF